ncbi:MAG: DMT family transporter [Bacteroidaceae bacterium]
MKQLKGFFWGLLSSVCFGFIPLFTLPLMESGLKNHSILFYRFLFAAASILLVLLVQRSSLKIRRSEIATLLYLAFLYDGSALFLLDSYSYMSTGVATTLHFTYPIIVTLVMIFFCGERKQWTTFLAILIAFIGVAVFSYSPTGNAVGLRGLVIVLVSAICYALYIVRVNRSRVREMQGLKLTFYVMVIGMMMFAVNAVREGGIQPIPNAESWLNFLLLAIICTTISNLALIYSVKGVGSTTTAILGALEPLTAVCTGILVYHEILTARIAIGILLILTAVILIVTTRKPALVLVEEEAEEPSIDSSIQKHTL